MDSGGDGRANWHRPEFPRGCRAGEAKYFNSEFGAYCEGIQNLTLAIVLPTLRGGLGVPPRKKRGSELSIQASPVPFRNLPVAQGTSLQHVGGIFFLGPEGVIFPVRMLPLRKPEAFGWWDVLEEYGVDV